MKSRMLKFLSNYVLLIHAIISCLLGLGSARQVLEEIFEFDPSISLDIIFGGNNGHDNSSSLKSAKVLLQPAYTRNSMRLLSTVFLTEMQFSTHPSILLLFPLSYQEFLEMSLKLKELLEVLEKRGLWRIWKPIIFIQWPIPDSTSSTFNSDTMATLGNLSMDYQFNFIFQMDSEISVWNYYRMNNQPVWSRIELDGLQTFMKTPSNLLQHPIRATALNDSENASMVSYKTTRNGKLEFDRGTSVSVLNDLKELINFTITAMQGTSYISQFPNGSMRGIGRELVDGEVDIAIPLSYVLPYRQAALTALHPLSVDKFLVFFRQPPASTVRYIFTQPFSSTLWLSLVLIWLLVELSILIFKQVQIRQRAFDKCETTSTLWNSSLLFLIALISQQGWHENPAQLSGKVLLMTGMFNGLVPFMAYSASVVSELSATVVPIKNFNDLLGTGYKLLADPLIGFGQYLTHGQTPTELQIEQMLAQDYVNGEESIRRVLKGRYGLINTPDFFGPIARSLNYSDKDICELVSWVPLPSVSLAMSFFVPKASPFKDILNTKILFIMERGLNHRYITTLNTDTRVACEQRVNKSKQEELGFRDLFAAFAIIFIGCLVSLVILVLEKLHYARGKQLELRLGFIY